MWFALAGVCAAVLSLAGIYLYLDPQVPNAETYRHVQLETPLRVYGEDGALLAEFGERRLIPIELEQVPQHFIDALLNTEDKRFYEHSGIDFISLVNDVSTLAVSMLFKGELSPGASTITMQLARNVSFTLDQRFLRKFKEMLLALKIEQALTKDEILELYINVVPFGKRAYGAQAAALTYYGKRLDELNLAQLAMLAGIPQLPSAGNPINGPERALTRRGIVLSLMRDQNSITQAQFDQARASPITAKIFARELDVPSPYPAEWVRQQMAERFDDLYTGGYQIFTTIDSRIQAAAIDALRGELGSYDRRHGYRGPEGKVEEELALTINTNAAVVVSQLMRAPGTIENTSKENDIAAKASPPLDPLSYAEDTTDAIRDYLRGIPLFGGLQPAVVVGAVGEHAAAVLSDGTIVQLHLDDSAWARPYVEVNLRGPKPESFDNLLQPGNLIRLRPRDKQTDPSAAAWQLAQLPDVQGAIVSIESDTGKVRALVGGYDFYRNQYNHALQAARQPGSGFKPFVYATAIAQGVTPADIFMDAPLVFDDANLESEYRPGNDSSRYNGPTRLRQALYSSINLVSIRVFMEIGAGPVLDYVSNFGFSTKSFPRNSQLAIGGGTMAVTPLDMTRAYSVIANGGYLVDPYIVDFVKNYDGEVILRSNHPRVCEGCNNGTPPHEEASPAQKPGQRREEPATLEDLLAQQNDADTLPIDTLPNDTTLADNPVDKDLVPGIDQIPSSDNLLDAQDQWDDLTPIQAPRVIDERIAYIMHTMLQDVIKKGTGRRARILKRNDLAGKTGTTNEAADTWFNGYGGGLATTVWVGFSNHTPLGANAYGSNLPLPIWIDVMGTAFEGRPEAKRAQPPGVVTLKIDPKTGKPASPGQSSAIFEYFLREFAPQENASGDASKPNDEGEIRAVDLF